MAQLDYVPDSNDQFQGFECLPAGEYKVQIVDTYIKIPKSGEGEMLTLSYEVVGDPQFDGRKVYDNIMLKHSNADAERIGKQKLNTICVLTGVKRLKDSPQLHGKTLSLLVTVKEYNGEKQNQIKKYLPFSSAPTAQHEESEEQIPGSKPRFVK